MVRRWVVQVGLVFLWLTPCAAVAQDYPRYRAVGSTYVPLDSWVYPVFERLAAQGYVQTAMLGMKPWTRFECARLVDEAEEILRTRVREDKGVEEQAAAAAEALAREFAYELDLLGGGPHRTARVESLYTRVTSISGPPLTDGFHFGQTISYDFGRPNRRGTNGIAGGSAYASAGPWTFYARGEYQHAPSAPALADNVLDFISRVDAKPREQARTFDPINRARLLEGYVALNVRNWQLSFGKQSLAWGGGGGRELLLSNNADPLWMIRLQRVVPQRLPFLLRYLGPVRTEFFWSRVEGTTSVVHPNLYGTRISTRPHPRLELGFGHTVLIGGRGGTPLTFRTFSRSFFGLTTKPTNPGDSRISMDFAWRVPGLGNSLVLYGEFFQDDEPAPFVNPGKAAIRPGIYLARFPGIANLDFRLEYASTESPDEPDRARTGKLNYWNFQYPDGYVNRNFLLGNTVGRAGQAIEVLAGYWFSPQQRTEFHFKDHTVFGRFVPGGGHWQDYGLSHEAQLKSGMYLKGRVQFERIDRFPLLFTGSKRNVTAALELGFRPEGGLP